MENKGRIGMGVAVGVEGKAGVSGALRGRSTRRVCELAEARRQSLRVAVKVGAAVMEHCSASELRERMEGESGRLEAPGGSDAVAASPAAESEEVAWRVTALLSDAHLAAQHTLERDATEVKESSNALMGMMTSSCSLGAVQSRCYAPNKWLFPWEGPMAALQSGTASAPLPPHAAPLPSAASAMPAAMADDASVANALSPTGLSVAELCGPFQCVCKELFMSSCGDSDLSHREMSSNSNVKQEPPSLVSGVVGTPSSNRSTAAQLPHIHYRQPSPHSNTHHSPISPLSQSPLSQYPLSQSHTPAHIFTINARTQPSEWATVPAFAPAIATYLQATQPQLLGELRAVAAVVVSQMHASKTCDEKPWLIGSSKGNSNARCLCGILHEYENLAYESAQTLVTKDASAILLLALQAANKRAVGGGANHAATDEPSSQHKAARGAAEQGEAFPRILEGLITASGVHAPQLAVPVQADTLQSSAMHGAVDLCLRHIASILQTPATLTELHLPSENLSGDLGDAPKNDLFSEGHVSATTRDKPAHGGSARNARGVLVFCGTKMGCEATARALGEVS